MRFPIDIHSASPSSSPILPSQKPAINQIPAKPIEHRETKLRSSRVTNILALILHLRQTSRLLLQLQVAEPIRIEAAKCTSSISAARSRGAAHALAAAVVCRDPI